MEFMRGNIDRGHFAIADFHSGRIGGVIDLAFDVQSGAGRGRGDQLHDGLVADQRLTAPVLCDEREQTMLDPVPFAGAGRQMADGRWQMADGRR